MYIYIYVSAPKSLGPSPSTNGYECFQPPAPLAPPSPLKCFKGFGKPFETAFNGQCSPPSHLKCFKGFGKPFETAFNNNCLEVFENMRTQEYPGKCLR